VTLDGKIDSVYDFTDKGLRELESWLEPWLKGESKGEVSLGGGLDTEDVGTSAPPIDSGIFFETFPQQGDWLVVETIGNPGSGGEPPNVGILLRASDGTRVEGTGFDVNVTPDGVHIDSLDGGGTTLREQGGGGMIISSNGGGLSISESTGGLSIQAGGGLSISGDPYGRLDFGFGEGISISPQTGDTLRIHHLPIADPSVADAIWNDSGTLVFSGSTAGGGGTATGLTIPFSIFGALAVANGGLPWDVLDAGTITKIQASLGIAPTGSGLSVRINKNGASVATLTIAAGQTKASSTPSIAVVAGDRLTVDVTAVGSTTPGSHLVVLLQVS
jgi:hypothetical protein